MSAPLRLSVQVLGASVSGNGSGSPDGSDSEITSGSEVTTASEVTVHDVAVGAAAAPEQLLAALDFPSAALRLPDGAVLRPGASLGEQGVENGGRLLLDLTGADPADPAPSGGSTAADPPDVGARRSGARVLLAIAGLLCLGGAAALVAALDDAQRVPTAAGLLILAAVAGALAASGDRGGGRGGETSVADVVRVALPPLGGAAVAVAVTGSSAGQQLLAGTAGLVTVAALAAVLRADARVLRGTLSETVLLLETVLGAVLAAATGAALLADVPLRAVALVAAALALPALRLLPGLIVRVPDGLLLDADTMAVTAWSVGAASSTAVPAASVAGRNADRVHAGAVRARIERERMLLDGAVVAAIGVGVSCLVVGLMLSRGPRVALAEKIGAGLVAAALIVGFALLSREVRGLLARVALLVGALAAVVAVSGWLVTFGTAGRIAVALGGGLGAVVVLSAGLASAEGWRSLRLARLGDLVEGFAVALAVPAALTAAGVVGFVRSLVS